MDDKDNLGDLTAEELEEEFKLLKEADYELDAVTETDSDTPKVKSYATFDWDEWEKEDLPVSTYPYSNPSYSKGKSNKGYSYGSGKSSYNGYTGNYGGYYSGAGSYSGGYSGIWAGRWGYGQTFTSQREELVDGLETVARTVYVALGAERESQSLHVAFPDEKDENTKAREDVICLDRKVLTTEGETRPEFKEKSSRTDVLCGDALVGAASKTTVTGEVWKTAQDEGERTKRLYEATEMYNAGEQTLQHAPGFLPYLESRVRYRTDEKYIQSLQTAAADPDLNVATAVQLIEHELTDRGVNPISYGEYDEAVVQGAEILAACENSQQRLLTAKKLLQELATKMKNPGGSGNGEGLSKGRPSDKVDSMLIGKNPHEGGTDGKEEENNITGETIIAPITHDSEARISKEVQAKDGGRMDVDVHVKYVKPGDGRKAGLEQESKAYKELKSAVNPQIVSLRNKITFRNNDTLLTEKGRRSGTLDDGSLDKLAMRGEGSPPVFEVQEVISKPDICFGILVDESGSMGDSDDPGNSAYHARRIAVILYEALAGIKGTTLCVFGHTSVSSKREDCILFVYMSPTQDKENKAAMTQITGRNNNYDSFAMEKSGQLMYEWYPRIPEKYLFVVSDGQPAGAGYGGASAQKHMLKVCADNRRRRHVETIGIGVANAYSQEWGDKAYGEGKSVVLPDVESAGTVIGAFITRLIKNK